MTLDYRHVCQRFSLSHLIGNGYKSLFNKLQFKKVQLQSQRAPKHYKQKMKSHKQGDNLLGQFVAQSNQFSINNEKPLNRDLSKLKKVQMIWQHNQDTLFQYKEIFTDRLRSLRKAFHVEQQRTIEDLSGDLRACELVGLFKRIQAKRVRAFEPDYYDKYENHKPLFSENDTYELEDETSKVKLEIRPNTKLNGSGKFKALQTPYGVIIKCKGEYSPKLNRFILSNVQTPKPAAQQKMILPRGEPKFMLVMCEPKNSDLIRVLDFIRNSINKNNLDVSELVVIGGIDFNDLKQIKQFDELIFQLGAIVNVFIVPTSSIETSYIYPLSPVPKTLLQKSYQYKNVANCANPQILSSKIKSLCLNTFVSCGQNLLNLKANCNIQDELELMKLIIEYRHICPSSAFSLPIQSYNYDPLIMNSTPHLMIHGKCETFQTEFWQRQNGEDTVHVRLVGLAKGDFVRINLTSNTLETIKWQI